MESKTTKVIGELASLVGVWPSPILVAIYNLFDLKMRILYFAPKILIFSQKCRNIGQYENYRIS